MVPGFLAENARWSFVSRKGTGALGIGPRDLPVNGAGTRKIGGGTDLDPPSGGILGGHPPTAGAPALLQDGGLRDHPSGTTIVQKKKGEVG